MFSYRFSRWKLISRLVNTLESDSKRHAVRSALPAVLPGPGLDLLFVLIEFICLPLASASLFFVCGLERRLCSKNCSTKQTAGIFNLLGSVLLTGCLCPVCFESVFCLSELMVGCLLGSVWRVKRWLDLRYVLTQCDLASDFSWLIRGASFFQKPKPTSCFLGHSDITCCVCDLIQSYAVLETAL